ncbi:hypothetical protein FIM1_4394 [Kluyveromyces marxianus]|uniref:Thioredoxin domain-containing protein n=1 Tax=Kluyveromyces marxianus TaxID=4911 RepID=A0ABX6F2G3_KLUMA|nr:hypothetical protein FIM1_4394 [Kluyveromyces marxianus]
MLLWLVWFETLWWLALGARIFEVHDTDEFYDAVLYGYSNADANGNANGNAGSAGALSPKSTLLYVYKPGCRYCAALEPKLDYLTDMFPNEEAVQFVKINGVQASQLEIDLNVRSFPQLFLFKPKSPSGAIKSVDGTDSRHTVHHYYTLSRFQGERTIERLAQWVSKTVGEMIHWPESRVNYDIVDMESFRNTLPQDAVDTVFPSPEAETTLGNASAVCLAFINPWIDLYYQDMFNGDIEALILEKLSKAWPQVKFYVLDTSTPELSPLFRQLQISHAPTISFIYNGKILYTQLLPMDRNSNSKEEQYLADIISTCVVGAQEEEKQCEDLIRSLDYADFFKPSSPLADDANDPESDLRSSDEEDENELDEDLPFDIYDL